MNTCGIVAEQFASAVDYIRRCGVQRRDLVQHQFLVRHGLRHCDRRTQRANGSCRCAVNALYQLDIVLFHQIKRKIALHRHGHLRQQVLCPLAHIK